jgi:hypothetical protein
MAERLREKNVAPKSTQPLNGSVHKKTGRRKLNSPPGLKLLVRNYEIAP